MLAQHDEKYYRDSQAELNRAGLPESGNAEIDLSQLYEGAAVLIWSGDWDTLAELREAHRRNNRLNRA